MTDERPCPPEQYTLQARMFLADYELWRFTVEDRLPLPGTASQDEDLDRNRFLEEWTQRLAMAFRAYHADGIDHAATLVRSQGTRPGLTAFDRRLWIRIWTKLWNTASAVRHAWPLPNETGESE